MSDLFEAYSSCPLCGGVIDQLREASCAHHPLWHEPLPTALTWMRCTACGHVHTRSFWTDAGLDVLFEGANQSQHLKPTDNIDALRTGWSPVVERAVRLLGGYGVMARAARPPVWLDVGFGAGGLLMAAGDAGFAPKGVDARLDTVSRAGELGFEAIAGSLLDDALAATSFGAPASVDVLSMMDVLEHFAYPGQALDKAARLLRPGGLLVLSMPDLTCSSWRILDQRNANPYWAELEHHHNFSRARLLALLGEHGFEAAGFASPHRYKCQMEVYATRAPAAVGYQLRLRTTASTLQAPPPANTR